MLELSNQEKQLISLYKNSNLLQILYVRNARGTTGCSLIAYLLGISNVKNKFGCEE